MNKVIHSLKSSRYLASFFASVLAGFGLLASPLPVRAAACVSGELIKGSGSAVYYCGADARRYVFPNQKTYGTWYPDFSGVRRITDAELASLPIGGNVTYRPGIRLVKITSDPKVYAVTAGGVLRPIASESVATALYGSAWAKSVDDISDAYFVNYLLGSPITDASQFSPSTAKAGALSINGDKGLVLANSTGVAGVTLAVSPAVTTISAGQTVTLTATASDGAGVSSVGIFVNNQAVQTCTQNGTPVSATCTATINGSDYADGTALSVYGQEVSLGGTRRVSSTTTLTSSGGSSGAGGAVFLSFSPVSTTLNAGQTTAVTVTANDPAGVSSVSLFVNGALVQSCGQSGTSQTVTCAATLYGSNYPSGTTVTVYGQEINRNGTPTISATTNLSVLNGSTASGSVTLNLSPNSTTLAMGDSLNVQVSGYAPFGVSRLELYANGTLAQSCPASGANAHANCVVALNSSKYQSGTTVPIYGRLTDTEGNTLTSSTTNLSIIAGTSVNSTVALSFSPYATTLPPGQTTTVSAFAQDSVNVSVISIYANGVLVQTCHLPGTSASATCAVTLNGSNYSSGSSVAIYAQEGNVNGGTNISATSTLTVGTATAANGSVSLFMSPAVSAITGTQSVTVTANAYDPSGLSSVNILVNGANVRSCGQSGVWPAGASCSYTLSATSYAHGTSLSITGQGVNTGGGVTGSAATMLTVN